MSDSRLIEVVGAVIVEDGKIFATRRGPGKALSGFWEFPGGKIEPTETPGQALSREIMEELECAIIVGEKIVTTDYTYDFGTVRLTTFWSALGQGRPSLTEHTEARWLSPEELNSVEWAPADIPAVQRIFESLA